MAKYYVEAPGALTIAKIANALNAEEALVTKFVSSQLWVNSSNELTNLVSFDELADVPVPIPPPLAVSITAPADGILVWTGPMIVNGSAKTVYISRS